MIPYIIDLTKFDNIQWHDWIWQFYVDNYHDDTAKEHIDAFLGMYNAVAMDNKIIFETEEDFLIFKLKSDIPNGIHTTIRSSVG